MSSPDRPPKFNAGRTQRLRRRPRDVAEVTRALRHTGRRVMLVPTMGALHDGHLALVRAAKRVPGVGGGGVDLRQPACSSAPARISTPTRGPSTTTWRCCVPRGSRSPSPRRAAGDVPGRPAHHGASRPAGRRARGCVPPNTFRRHADRGAQAAADRAAGPGVLRREGLSAAGAGPPDGRRPQRRRRRSSACRSCGRPTGWRCRRATAISTPRSASRPARCRRRCWPGRTPRPGGADAALDAARAVLDDGARDRRRLPGGPRPRAGARPRSAAPAAYWSPPDSATPGCSTTSQSKSELPSASTGECPPSRLIPRITLEELMLRTMLKSKIHRATVTQADLHYVGSVTIDADLMDAADLLEGEQVTIVDIDNGARLVTYAITGRARQRRDRNQRGRSTSRAPRRPGDPDRLRARWKTPRRAATSRGSCSSTPRTGRSIWAAIPAFVPPMRPSWSRRDEALC